MLNEIFNKEKAVVTLKQECPTRWHSILDMLESISKNKVGVTQLLLNCGRGEENLFEDEWELVTVLIELLKCIKSAVELLSGSKYPTINMSILFQSEISSCLQPKPNGGDSAAIVELKKRMLEMLPIRFPYNQTNVLAALLDPRMKDLKMITLLLQQSTYRGSRVDFIKASVGIYQPPEDEAALYESADAVAEKRQKVSVFDLAKKHSGASDKGIDAEILALMSTPAEAVVDGDILSFWKQRSKESPKLANAAKGVFCITGTSTPCERVFSSAGLVVTAKRSKLCPAKVDKCVFIHDNYDYCKEYCE